MNRYIVSDIQLHLIYLQLPMCLAVISSVLIFGLVFMNRIKPVYACLLQTIHLILYGSLFIFSGILVDNTIEMNMPLSWIGLILIGISFVGSLIKVFKKQS